MIKDAEMDFDQIQSALCQRIGQERFELWFDGVDLRIEGQRFKVIAERAFTLDRLRKDFRCDIEAVAEHLGIPQAGVEFVVGPVANRSSSQASPETVAVPFPGGASAAASTAPAARPLAMPWNESGRLAAAGHGPVASSPAVASPAAQAIPATAHHASTQFAQPAVVQGSLAQQPSALANAAAARSFTQPSGQAAGAAVAAAGTAPQPQLVSRRSAPQSVPTTTGHAGVAPAGGVATPARLRAGSAQQRGRRFKTYDTFQRGLCNQLAFTSMDMAAAQPGELSPLVLHGPSGVGKSHLVEAHWCSLKRANRRARVVYLTAEQFTTYFLDALKSSGLPAFRRKYRQAEVLIIDDIQFFAGKQATLVELAYTIDELGRDNRQLILTADRPPAQLAMTLGQDVANRLGGGLVCGMKPVDAVTLEGICERWAQQRQVTLPPSVQGLLASKVPGDARQLTGILNRLHATSVATGQPITARMVNEVTYELVPSQARIIRLQDIHKAICQVFGLQPEMLQQQSRSRAITQPRMLAMWLARKHTTAGLHEISQFFGRKSHSSAVTAHNAVNDWISKGSLVALNGQNCDVRDVVGRIETHLMAG